MSIKEMIVSRCAPLFKMGRLAAYFGQSCQQWIHSDEQTSLEVAVEAAVTLRHLTTLPRARRNGVRTPCGLRLLNCSVPCAYGTSSSVNHLRQRFHTRRPALTLAPRGHAKV